MKNYTTKFSIYQALYALMLMPFFAYGAYYLIYLNQDSLTIGIILATSYALAALLQTPIASLSDKEIISLTGLLKLTLLIFIASALALAMGVFPIVSFSLTLILLYLINPLINALSIEMSHSGYELDFGISRGMSSLSYALFSVIIGRILLLTGPKILPLASAIGGIILLILLSLEKIDLAPKKHSHEKKARVPLFKAMPNLIGLMLGISLVYANYSMFNSYLIKTIESLGGSESSLGLAVAIASAAEVPTMFIFSKIMNRFKLRHLLVISAFFFTLKTFVAYLAGSMTILYLSQFIQMFSFGIYLPTSVYYMASITSEEYRAEAQASATGATTFGSLFASLLGGALIHYLSISHMLLIATLISVLGTIMIFIFTERIEREK